MSDLDRALGEISNIRRQVARSTEFRGYGPVTLAITGIIAVLAASVQALWLPSPANHAFTYLGIWSLTAFGAAVLSAVQMYTRSRRMHSGLSDEMIRMAVEQFLPSLAAGLLLTLIVLRFTPATLWILPGVWQIIFSLGIFSSCRFLPRPMLVAGSWYLLTGMACIAFGDARALSPWAMGLPFGAGQLLVAAILLRTNQESADED